MNQDSELPLNSVRVDGGMTENKLMLQLQADILGIKMGTTTLILYYYHSYTVGNWLISGNDQLLALWALGGKIQILDSYLNSLLCVYFKYQPVSSSLRAKII